MKYRRTKLIEVDIDEMLIILFLLRNPTFEAVLALSVSYRLIDIDYARYYSSQCNVLFSITATIKHNTKPKITCKR